MKDWGREKKNNSINGIEKLVGGESRSGGSHYEGESFAKI